MHFAGMQSKNNFLHQTIIYHPLLPVVYHKFGF